MTHHSFLARRFISFEGIDFSGKSTQITLLKQYLEERGEEVYVLREPGGTPISEQIRSILLDKNNKNMCHHAEIFLYSAARAQLVEEKIRPLLEQGVFVIADRYVDSTTAYQGYGRGVDLTIVKAINRAATYGLMPSITFLLDIEPQLAFLRRKKNGLATDRMEEGGLDFFTRIYTAYHEMARNEQKRFVIIDANQPIEKIHIQIVQSFHQKLQV